MKKNLLLSLLATPLLLVACNKDKTWKEISKEEAIKVKDRIFNNVKLPEYYSSTMTVLFVGEEINTDGDQFNRTEKYYLNVMPYTDESSVVKTEFRYFVVEENSEIWEYRAKNALADKKEDQERFEPECVGIHRSDEEALREIEKQIILGYYEIYLNFEDAVSLVDQWKEEGKTEPDYIASYKLYTTDNKTSLKGEATAITLVEKHKSKSVEILFENNLPTHYSQIQYKNLSEEKETIANIDFNYKKESHLPKDVNQKDWLPEQ